jgi:ankyrin repeat protein
MVAAERSHLETVKVFMKQGADVQVRSNRGWTKLMVVVAGGHTEITSLFWDQGINWGVKSNAG